MRHRKEAILRARQRTWAHRNVAFKQTIRNFSRNDDKILDTAITFACECSRPDCHETILISINDYETGHDPENIHFIKIGHENPEIEETISRHDRYLVVKKLKHMLHGTAQ